LILVWNLWRLKGNKPFYNTITAAHLNNKYIILSTLSLIIHERELENANHSLRYFISLINYRKGFDILEKV